jgi:hypothetical protein
MAIAREQKREFEQVLEEVEGQAVTYASEYTGLSLEGHRECREKVAKTLKTLQKISKDLEEEESTDIKTARLTRHNELKNELQRLYNEEAVSYDPTAGGNLFPPHGMCPANTALKIVDSFHSQITAAEKGIAQLEDEPKKNPYVPSSLHNMIVLQPGETSRLHGQDMRTLSRPEKRNEIIRKISNAMADKRIAQEGLKFWETVRPATTEYMQKIKDMFIEKNKLRHQLLAENGIAVPSW